MIPDATKHEISTKFVDSMNDMKKGLITLDEFIEIVDETERQYPSDNRFSGDDRQKDFYAAIRELATKVDARVSGKPQPEKETN